MIPTVRTCLARLVPIACVLLLAACGPAKKSVFPPAVTLQEVTAKPGGVWHLTLRIRNNSYGGMAFQSFQGTLRVGDLGGVLMDVKVDQDIPSFAADVAHLDLLPTPEMSRALAELAAKGSAGSLPYTIDGHIGALPEQEKTPRSFDVHGRDWLSPVPGIPDTYRSP
jgi:glyoxylate carboligase